jgi:hypothetical protein
LEHQATVQALRATAQRIQALATEADQLQAELAMLVSAVAPWLLEVPGVGPFSAAQVLVSWSHAGRFRGGDRQRNRALHTIVLVRLRIDPDTRAYMAHRTAEGNSRRDARRCLRRVIARQLFRLLERYANAASKSSGQVDST